MTLSPEQVLSDPSLEPAERILTLLESGQWPDAVFHQFACDCAERALQFEQQQGREPAQVSWDALHTRRQWLQKKTTPQELAQARTLAHNAAHERSHKQEGYEAALAVADALSDVRYAPRAAAWALTSISQAASSNTQPETQSQEAEWQLSHLLALLQDASKS